MGRVEGRVNLSGPIGTMFNTDTFPTFYDVDGKGGFRCVSTLEDRDSIFEDRMSDGMMVYVSENSTTYQWLNGVWVESDIINSSTLNGLTDVDTSDKANGKVLTYNSGSSKWTANDIPKGSIYNSTDVNIYGIPDEGHVLTMGGDGYWTDLRIPYDSIANLTDTDLSSLSNNQILMWNGTNWTNTDLSATVVPNMESIPDVDISDVVDGNILKWNGTKWVNSDVGDINTISDVNTDAPTDGQVLSWNGVVWRNMNVAELSVSTLNDITGVDVEGADDGAMMVWDQDSYKWIDTDVIDFGTF